MSGRISSAMVSSIIARASSASVNRSSKVISCPVRRSILTAAHSCVARSVSSAPLERIATLSTSSASAAEYVTVSGTGEDISTAIRLNRFSIFPACKIASFTCCWMLSSAIPVISGYLTLLLPSVSPFSVICGTFSIASGAAGAFVACGTSTGRKFRQTRRCGQRRRQQECCHSCTSFHGQKSSLCDSFSAETLTAESIRVSLYLTISRKVSLHRVSASGERVSLSNILL